MNNNKQVRISKTISNVKPVPLYHPIIYNYSCTGRYSLSSDIQGSDGNCWGIRSRLQLMADMKPSTREDAINILTDMSGNKFEEDDITSMDQKSKSIVVSPAIIYEEKASDEVQSSKLPDEELIRQQKWICYGYTDVRYLALKNAKTGEEHIAAVAPRNNHASFRSISTDDTKITTLDFFVVSLIFNMSHSEDTDRKNKSGFLQSATGLDVGKSFGDFASFMSTVGDHMKYNSLWLYENLRNDFPARTYTAGGKIISNVPVTVERTSTFLKKLWKNRRSQDDDDEAD